LERWRDAERVYRRSVELHPENAEAWLGLSRIYRELGEHEHTITSALEAVGLVYRLPHAHLNLGIALAELGETEKAITALKTALRFSPRFGLANRWLAKVYKEQVEDLATASRYARRADRAEERLADKAVPERGERAETLFELPEIPSEAARFRRLLEERPDRQDPRKPSGKTFVLVSGLPRSGTSLMMQMLEAAGLPAKTSADRPADVDNPKGYYEWEAIKKIATNPHLMLEDGLESQAIKVVSALLDSMPYAHNYKTIFMTRPIEQVAASQKRMIDRLETEGSSQSTEELIADLVRHRTFIKKRMEMNSRNDVLEIDYPTLVQSPMEQIPLIQEFLGELLPNPEKMIEVIDTSLYRQRK
ncbi:MAG: tetratricopeptide repeat protein, partial [Pseudomonadota bacterium]